MTGEAGACAPLCPGICIPDQSSSDTYAAIGGASTDAACRLCAGCTRRALESSEGAALLSAVLNKRASILFLAFTT